MRLPDEDNERGISTPVKYTIAAVSALILIILTFVLISNRQNNTNRGTIQTVSTPSPEKVMEEEMEFSEGQNDIESLYKEHKLRSEDLDFWDMYQNNEPEILTEDSQSPEPSAESSPSPSAEPTDEEMAADGKHILVTYMDGTTQWLEIDEDLPVNDYDFTKLKTKNGKMTYYDGNKKLSRLGIELSKDSGTVDFEALKEEGIDFVMLKVGERGYGTGLISSDVNFTSNIEAARKAGMDVGVYFCSQAVTVEEAVEEAKFVTDQLVLYDITYPVALRMESILSDTARTDILDAEQRTEIAEAFLNDVESAGYDTILYGERDFLLTEILTSELLKDFEVWLTDQNPIPDYPYQFKMWEYAAGTTVSGVEKEVNMTISFVDYSKR